MDRKEYYEKNKDREIELSKLYYKKNKQKIKENKKKHYQKNKEKIIEDRIRIYHERRDAGLCPVCGGKRDSVNIVCDDCLAKKLKNYYKNKKSK